MLVYRPPLPLQEEEAMLLQGLQGLGFWAPCKETGMEKPGFQFFLVIIIFSIVFAPFYLSTVQYLCLTPGIWLHNQNLSRIIETNPRCGNRQRGCSS